MGISFAIPIDEAIRISDQIRATGHVTRGRIGVGIADVTKDVAEPLGLQRATGALVRSVESGGPADKAGVEAGDIILRYDGRVIERSTDLPRLVGATRPGSRVTVSVWRKGKLRELTVTVVELQSEFVARSTQGNRSGPGLLSPQLNALGLSVVDLADERRSALKIKGGVVVENVEGAASRAGVRVGDVIVSLNNQDVSNAKSFNDSVSRLDRGKTHVVLVRRGDTAQFIAIRPDLRPPPVRD